MELKPAHIDLAEIVERAETEGPQTFEVEGRAAAVISLEDLKQLQARKPTFIEFLKSFPSLEDLDLERDRTPARDIEF